MIKENQKHFNRLQVVIDAFVIALSYFLAWVIKFYVPFLNDNVGRLPFRVYMSALLFIVPGYLILNYAFNMYTPKRMQGRRLELSNIIKANTIGMFLFVGVLYLGQADRFLPSCDFYFLCGQYFSGDAVQEPHTTGASPDALQGI